eukprot:6214745-Pleurochrysis_carterae.AAC.5
MLMNVYSKLPGRRDSEWLHEYTTKKTAHTEIECTSEPPHIPHQTHVLAAFVHYGSTSSINRMSPKFLCTEPDGSRAVQGR